MTEIPDLVYGRFVGSSAPMRQVYQLIAAVSEAVCPVIIFGETGTGKELVARAIHDNSRRNKQPFVPVDCGALVPTLIESELFGYVRGSFTGAIRSRQGLFEAAQGGSVFLDEIADLPLDLQSRLLRALQEGEIRPVGTTRPVKIDVRYIAATNRNLEAAVHHGTFRNDLYHRLNVVNLWVPPLRERKSDIPLLAEYFLEKFRRPGRAPLTLSEEALNNLIVHDWPGNVRELENRIERAAVLTVGPVLRSVDIGLDGMDHKRSLPLLAEDVIPLRELARVAILQAILKTHGDKGLAARMLKIGKTTLYRKLKEYRIGEGTTFKP